MSRAAQKRNPGRGSQRLHRALGGTRILLAAAPTAPPCFCRWQRSSLLLFESTLAAPFARQIKQKLRYPLDTGVLGGRGWITRAAHLKKPRRGFFPRRTIRRVLRVALAAFSAAPWQGFEKAERCPSLASLFPPQAAVGSAAVRIHPCNPFCKTDKTETPVPIGYRSSWWARVDSNHRS